MHDLTFTQKSYRVKHIGIITESQYIIISHSCLLLCCKVFVNVRYYIAFDLHTCGRIRHTCCSGWIYACCMIDKVLVKPCSFYFLN